MAEVHFPYPKTFRPCEVTIGPDTYEGAMYECVGEYIANQDAIVRGGARRATCTSSVHSTSWATCPKS